MKKKRKKSSFTLFGQLKIKTLTKRTWMKHHDYCHIVRYTTSDDDIKLKCLYCKKHGEIFIEEEL